MMNACQKTTAERQGMKRGCGGVHKRYDQFSLSDASGKIRMTFYLTQYDIRILKMGRFFSLHFYRMCKKTDVCVLLFDRTAI